MTFRCCRFYMLETISCWCEWRRMTGVRGCWIRLRFCTFGNDVDTTSNSYGRVSASGDNYGGYDPQSQFRVIASRRAHNRYDAGGSSAGAAYVFQRSWDDIGRRLRKLLRVIAQASDVWCIQSQLTVQLYL